MDSNGFRLSKQLGFSSIVYLPILWCLIQGDRQAFKVAPPLYIDVDDLKQFIHDSIESTVPPKDLILWKVWAMYKQS